jgi:hypothetical protein
MGHWNRRLGIAIGAVAVLIALATVAAAIVP